MNGIGLIIGVCINLVLASDKLSRRLGNGLRTEIARNSITVTHPNWFCSCAFGDLFLYSDSLPELVNLEVVATRSLIQLREEVKLGHNSQDRSDDTIYWKCFPLEMKNRNSELMNNSLENILLLSTRNLLLTKYFPFYPPRSVGAPIWNGNLGRIADLKGNKSTFRIKYATELFFGTFLVISFFATPLKVEL